MSVKMNKGNFDAFKVTNIGKNRKKVSIPHDVSVQNQLAMNSSSQFQLL